MPKTYERAKPANRSAETAFIHAEPRKTRRPPARSASDEKKTSETAYPS